VQQYEELIRSANSHLAKRLKQKMVITFAVYDQL
jgi:hypothetical protein